MQFFGVYCLYFYSLTHVIATLIDLDEDHVTVQNLEPSVQKYPHLLQPHARFKNTPLSSSKLDPQQVDELLQEFYARLRSFILESHFDTFRFGIMAANLDEDWQKIVKNTSEYIPTVTGLAQQIQFVSHVFEQMKQSAELLDSVDYVGSAVNYLLNRVVDLNIRLYAFCNSYGTPDTQMPAYGERFSACWRELLHYDESCRNLPNISSILRKFFEDRLSQASLIANFLGRSS